MSKGFFLLLSFCSCLPCSSQSKSKSKFDSLVDLTGVLMYEQSDSALYLTDKAVEIAESQGDLWMMAMAYGLTAHVQAESGQNHLAYLNYLKALRLMEESDTIDYANVTILYDGLALIHFNYGNYDEAILYSEKAIENGLIYINNYRLRAAKLEQLDIVDLSKFTVIMSCIKKGDYLRAEDLILDLLTYSDFSGDFVTYPVLMN